MGNCRSSKSNNCGLIINSCWEFLLEHISAPPPKHHKLIPNITNIKNKLLFFFQKFKFISRFTYFIYNTSVIILSAHLAIAGLLHRICCLPRIVKKRSTPSSSLSPNLSPPFFFFLHLFLLPHPFLSHSLKCPSPSPPLPSLIWLLPSFLSSNDHYNPLPRL